MRYRLSEIACVADGKLRGEDCEISFVIFDSREFYVPDKALFVAIEGDRNDGHSYIRTLSDKGVSAFLVSSKFTDFDQGNSYVVVEDTLKALQCLASYSRGRIGATVAAITGSNGKTIVKEWTSQICGNSKKLFRSPKSYNSQLGVALSLLIADSDSEKVIIEAGISRVGEMRRLERMISPDIMLITNIGSAHSDGFSSMSEKLSEKMILGEGAKTIVYCKDDKEIAEFVEGNFTHKNLFSWGGSDGVSFRVMDMSVDDECRYVDIVYRDDRYSLKIPFPDWVSYHNAMHSVALSLVLGENMDCIVSQVSKLQPVAMRLEMLDGIGGAKIINDTYNSDPNSLSIALDKLSAMASGRHKCVILSDIYQSGYNDGELYELVAQLIKKHNITRFVGVGPNISSFMTLFPEGSLFYKNTDSFIERLNTEDYNGTALLIKGSRDFEFERVCKLVEQKIHTTIMEVDFDAMISNLNYYRSLINRKTKCMAMVKAYSYGSGSYEVAYELVRNGVDYLAVAFADEGITLRRHGITIPIVVLNSDPSGFDAMISHHLEPEIYSFSSLENFSAKLSKAGVSGYPIHIKLDTGMHRLGFCSGDIDSLVSILKENRNIKVASVFSHFTSSDMLEHDNYTHEQIRLFKDMSSRIIDGLGYKPMLHICNSAAIERFPEAHFDMVRLGIGLYGISPFGENRLRCVDTLKSIVVQKHFVCKGDTVGYSKRGTVDKDMEIATISIGYADGLNRRLGCGNWSVYVNGEPAAIIGNICMDTCMIDVTGLNVKEGDEVIVFGEKPSAEQMAKVLGTIPYEVISTVAPRVRRIYIK